MVSEQAATQGRDSSSTHKLGHTRFIGDFIFQALSYLIILPEILSVLDSNYNCKKLEMVSKKKEISWFT